MLTKAEQYVKDLHDEGKRGYDDLDIPEKSTLTGFIMWELDAGGRFEFITEMYFPDDLTTELMRYLISRTHNFQADDMSAADNEFDCMKSLVASLCTNANLYAKKRINKLFEERDDQYVITVDEEDHADRI